MRVGRIRVEWTRTTHHVLSLFCDKPHQYSKRFPFVLHNKNKARDIPLPALKQHKEQIVACSRKRRPIHTQPTRHRSQTTHLDGRGQGGAQTARHARNHGCRGCCCESLCGWVGVWAGRRMLRRLTRSWLVHCVCLGVPIGSATTACARSAPLSGYWEPLSGRSCRGWAVLCVVSGL